MAAGAVTEKARVLKTEHAFEWAFGIGSVLIVLAKLIARGQPILGGVFAAVLGIAIMFWYKNNQSRVRPESEHPRMGDEVYYLGLLYTLTSLCAALVSLFLLFGGEQTLEKRTDEMIGSFGIALLTTMAGIVMRMTLQRRGSEGPATIIRIPHSVSDSNGRGVDIEGVPVDLERYAFELRRQLQNSTNAFASHANQAILQAKTTHAHMDEMVQAFQDGLEEKAKAELESLKAIYKATAEKAEEVRQRTDAQGEGIQRALGKLEAQVKSMDESIERIRGGSVETAANLEATGVQAKASAQALNYLAENTSMSNAISNLETNAKAVTEQLAGIAGAGKLYEEALDVNVRKLQALAEAADQEFGGRAKLKVAIAEIVEVLATASRDMKKLKDAEREIQQINNGTKQPSECASRRRPQGLAKVLKQVIISFEEAKHSNNSIWDIFKRMFKP